MFSLLLIVPADEETGCQYTYTEGINTCSPVVPHNLAEDELFHEGCILASIFPGPWSGEPPLFTQLLRRLLVEFPAYITAVDSFC